MNALQFAIRFLQAYHRERIVTPTGLNILLAIECGHTTIKDIVDCYGGKRGHLISTIKTLTELDFITFDHDTLEYKMLPDGRKHLKNLFSFLDNQHTNI